MSKVRKKKKVLKYQSRDHKARALKLTFILDLFQRTMAIGVPIMRQINRYFCKEGKKNC